MMTPGKLYKLKKLSFFRTKLLATRITDGSLAELQENTVGFFLMNYPGFCLFLIGEETIATVEPNGNWRWEEFSP
jgi:hypothetical protein